MATLHKRPGATPGYEILFFDTNGKRLTIYLGGRRYNETTAREVKKIVEELVFYRDNPDQIPRESTLKRIREFSDDIQQKLAKVGLVKVTPTHTVRELWDTFQKQKTDVEESTMTTYEAANDRFFAFFKGNELLTELTSATMQRWKTYLRTEIPRERSTGRGLAESTVAGTLTKTKAVFNWAVRVGWLDKSPLDGVGRGSYRNESKDRFVTMDEYRRLLDACPCQEWRVIITLARIGGLHPCEILTFRWSDIDEENNRFQVFNAKLKRYDGLYKREVPIFPEVAAELRQLRATPDNQDTEHVINRYPRRERSNLGTEFSRIAKRAGIGLIPRPFDNMRASRSTEIYKEYGPKAENRWIGHSDAVALQHYLMVTDDDYAIAAGKKAIHAVENRATWENSAGFGGCAESCREKSDFPTLEKIFPTRFPTVGSGIGWNGSEGKKSKGAVNP